MLRQMLSRTVALGAMAAIAVGLTGCTSEPSLVGMWQPDDGSGMKTVAEDGRCTGMIYNQGRPLDIGGGMYCTLGEKASDGTYTLVVQQPPNEQTYRVRFEGQDTAVLLTRGGETIVTLERQ